MRCRTRTGTYRCVPPVTISNILAGLLRRATKATGNSVVSLVYLLRQIHYGVWIAASRRYRKPRQQLMGKKNKNLFHKIIDENNLYRAYGQAAKGKRHTVGHLQFREHLAANLYLLQEDLRTGRYQPGKPHVFKIHEPKTREITAMPFVDRVAQHALCNVIEPIFERAFLPQSFACRVGRGTHAAAIAVQAELRRMHAKGAKPWVLKTDFSHYFASIKRDVLHREFRRKISCPPTIDLMSRMIKPTGTGIPIGNLTSQLAANVYGHIVDRWLVHSMGVSRFYRYMDDIVVLGHSREAMDVLRVGLGWFAESETGLKFSKWSIQPASRGINFVGYRIWTTHKLLRRSSVTAAKRKIRCYTRIGDERRLRNFLAAWHGHARRANSHNLINFLGEQK